MKQVNLIYMNPVTVRMIKIKTHKKYLMKWIIPFKSYYNLSRSLIKNPNIKIFMKKQNLKNQVVNSRNKILQINYTK